MNKKTSLSDLLDIWTIENGLSQHIKENTRFRLVDSELGTRLEMSRIDHLYSNYNLKYELFPSVSDHHMISINNVVNISQRKKVIIRDWKDFSIDLFNKDLSLILSKEKSVNNLSKVINSCLDVHAPYRVIRVNETQIINTKLEALKKRRDRYLKKNSKKKVM